MPAAHCISAIPILTFGCFRIGRETNNWTNVHIGPTSKLPRALSPRDYIADWLAKLVVHRRVLRQSAEESPIEGTRIKIAAVECFDARENFSGGGGGGYDRGRHADKASLSRVRSNGF